MLPLAKSPSEAGAFCLLLKKHELGLNKGTQDTKGESLIGHSSIVNGHEPGEPAARHKPVRDEDGHGYMTDMLSQSRMMEQSVQPHLGSRFDVMAFF